MIHLNITGCRSHWRTLRNPLGPCMDSMEPCKYPRTLQGKWDKNGIFRPLWIEIEWQKTCRNIIMKCVSARIRKRAFLQISWPQIYVCWPRLEATTFRKSMRSVFLTVYFEGVVIHVCQCSQEHVLFSNDLATLLAPPHFFERQEVKWARNGNWNVLPFHDWTDSKREETNISLAVFPSFLMAYFL